MNWLRDISLKDLSNLFQAATGEAKKEADELALPSYGVDEQGRLSGPKRPAEQPVENSEQSDPQIRISGKVA